METPSKVNRSVTKINLQWLSERVRKTEKIKKLISKKGYSVDSKSVVKALLNLKE